MWHACQVILCREGTGGVHSPLWDGQQDSDDLQGCSLRTDLSFCCLCRLVSILCCCRCLRRPDPPRSSALIGKSILALRCLQVEPHLRRHSGFAQERHCRHACTNNAKLQSFQVRLELDA